MDDSEHIRRAAVQAFAIAIMHGDESHRRWLTHAADAFLDGRTLPLPNPPDPIPMLLACPMCGIRHIDKYEYGTKPHHTHACQSCGHVWRPAVVATVGVKFLPGFRDPEPTE